MKNKRFAFALMVALLVCLLPMWAMGEQPRPTEPSVTVHDLSTLQNPYVQVASGDVITGTRTGTQFFLIVPYGVNEITLIIRDVNIRDGELWIMKENEDDPFTANLIFEGTNEIVANTAYHNAALKVEGKGIVTNISGSGSATLNGHYGISIHGDLNIQGGNIIATNNGKETFSAGIFTWGSLNITGGCVKASDLYTMNGCTLILPEYEGGIPVGMQLGGWNVNGMVLHPGYRVSLTGEVDIKPAFLPKTGDDSNVILWSALALMSVVGMAMLVRKRKQA